MATVTSLVVPGEERYQINLGGTRAVFEYARAVRGRSTASSSDGTRSTAPAPTRRSFTRRTSRRSRSTASPSSPTSSPPTSTPPPRSGGPRSSRPPSCASATRSGPSNHGTLAGFLRGKRVPMVLGFDPLFQFLHEDDVVRAIVLTLDKRPRGVFNVAGPQPLPLSRVVREAGRAPFPLPEFVLSGHARALRPAEAPDGRAQRTSSTPSSSTRGPSGSKRVSRTSTTRSRPYERSATRCRFLLERVTRAAVRRVYRPISLAT